MSQAHSLPWYFYKNFFVFNFLMFQNFSTPDLQNLKSHLNEFSLFYILNQIW